MRKFYQTVTSLGYVQAAPLPSVEELEQHYSNKYYQLPSGSYSKTYTEEEIRYFFNIAKVAIRTVERFNSGNMSLLDLGCGEGFFSSAFLKVNWNVLCCDFSKFGVSEHNPELLPFFQEGNLLQTVASLTAQRKHFGLINLQNVLEHVLSPEDLLISLHGLMNDDSILRIRVPNDFSDFQTELLNKGLSENTWFSPPEHLSYFNRDNLINTLNACDYSLISLQIDFPIELYLTNPHSNYWKDRSLGKAAHLSRIFCENFLINKNIDHYIDYSEAAGKLGFGREIIAYAKKKK
ncbi:MAG: class I SAM-dependent methyltransferase [Bdellovibrionota bacterium]